MTDLEVLTDLNQEEFSDFLIYPNPVQDKLFLGQKVRVEIYSTQGILENTYQSTETIDMSDYESGVYFLKIGKHWKKIIKS